MQVDLFKKSAVLIEQNAIQRKLYSDVLTANGFNVYIAKSALDGLMKIKETSQDLAVINTEIAEEVFIEKFINNIKSHNNTKDIPIVGLSIYSEECKKNVSKKVDAFLTKPLSIDRFMEAIFKCIEHNTNDETYSCN